MTYLKDFDNQLDVAVYHKIEDNEKAGIQHNIKHPPCTYALAGIFTSPQVVANAVENLIPKTANRHEFSELPPPLKWIRDYNWLKWYGLEA